ncbi:MAG: AAA family ATPase [Planctomycetes bacterium]|jgi:adenylate kinase|nr:AAA family ATPase [Planctomycetota bacterium]
MRIVVTGQVGLDKKPFLQKVVELAREQGFDLALMNLGEMMYSEAPDVPKGRILDLPLSRLQGLRRSVFKDVLSACAKHANVIVNTHATFRWRHGLFYAFDHDQMQALNADMYVVLVDNIDRVHYRLTRDGHHDHTLKDLMVWREEEVLATELLSGIVRGHGCFYIMARGGEQEDSAAEMLVRMIFRRSLRKAYLSFPMSHVGNGAASSAAMAQIEDFRRQMKRMFLCFDPGDVEEKPLCALAIQAAQSGLRSIEYGPAGAKALLDVSDLLTIIPDIDGQIYARDFKLIDQSDMIISLIPNIEEGRPCISSGVERELQHAHEAAKDVFVIWLANVHPSPFITETATEVFRSVEQAVKFFIENGYVPSGPPGRLFT